jgi:hypothetical protein
MVKVLGRLGMELLTTLNRCHPAAPAPPIILFHKSAPLSAIAERRTPGEKCHSYGYSSANGGDYKAWFQSTASLTRFTRWLEAPTEDRPQFAGIYVQRANLSSGSDFHPSRWVRSRRVMADHTNFNISSFQTDRLTLSLRGRHHRRATVSLCHSPG